MQRFAFSALIVCALAGSLEGGARLLVAPQSLPLLATPMQGNNNLTFATDVFAYDPDVFWKLRPWLRLQGAEASPWGDVTNSLGLRMARELSPDDTRQRILCVGDSCTYGLGVSVGEAWPSLLDDEFDAMNAGVPGYSSFQSARWCSRLAPVLRPDCVVAQLGVNDMIPWPTWQNGRSVMLTDRERETHVALWDVASRSRFFGWLLATVSAPTPVVIPHLNHEDLTGVPSRVPVDECAGNLRSMCAHARACVVVAWPERKLLEPDHRSPVPATRSAAYYGQALAMRGDGYRVVDVLDLFKKSGRTADELFLDNAHATPLGCKLVAEAVRVEVREALAAARR
jgi:lysophospholipase L1-like esterase